MEHQRTELETDPADTVVPVCAYGSDKKQYILVIITPDQQH